jgi:glycosyltransferase involved in cell wall biosynthesis
MKIQFITSTPLNFVRGSGTYAGISTLAKFLGDSGNAVTFTTPHFHLPVYTLERLVFNQTLNMREFSDADITVGFDMDGYALAGKTGKPHVASIKGVIADEMRFEQGITNATMRVQALCEKRHVRRADIILAPSRYSADRIKEFYAPTIEPRIVPEAIDLAQWRRLLEQNPALPPEGRFVVLCVCRFYPRKRVNVLLRAAERLRAKIPGLEIRMVGDGPEAGRLRALYREKKLQRTVTWLGNVSQTVLAEEYNRCHIFCLPSVQEAFGIVFLEAMASGKAIVAARAAAVPEVVKHGILAEADSDEDLAAAIERLYADSGLRAQLAAGGCEFVQQFDGPLVAREFLRQVVLRPDPSGRSESAESP